MISLDDYIVPNFSCPVRDTIAQLYNGGDVSDEELPQYIGLGDDKPNAVVSDVEYWYSARKLEYARMELQARDLDETAREKLYKMANTWHRDHTGKTREDILKYLCTVICGSWIYDIYKNKSAREVPCDEILLSIVNNSARAIVFARECCADTVPVNFTAFKNIVLKIDPNITTTGGGEYDVQDRATSFDEVIIATKPATETDKYIANYNAEISLYDQLKVVQQRYIELIKLCTSRANKK